MHSSISLVNGLYVVSWLSLCRTGFDDTYATTLYFSKQFGGRKFHNKRYGGGIAFDHLPDAQYALECATGKHLCVNCKSVLMDYDGELCPECEAVYEKLQVVKDLQRQADREKYCNVK